MQNTLMDVLGVLIAFISLILLFSIVVAGLVQVTQSLLRLRARNLAGGIKRVLDKARTEENNQEVTLKVAHDLLAESSVALSSPFEKWVWGSAVSWIAPQQLSTTIKEKEKEKPKTYDPDKAEKLLKSIEDPLSKRFQLWTRLLSIAFAALIAGYFQLSTPQLLADLSTSPAMVEELTAEGQRLLAGGTPTLDISPGRDPDFFSNWPDRAGWLITVLLLSLGAPFWFNVLKEIVSFSDQLRGRAKNQQPAEG